MRAVMLTPYFPKPGNPLIGPWALERAQALRQQGVDLTVVSHTSWVPRALGRLPRARAWAETPATHSWDGLPVLYPRWLYYSQGPHRRWSYEHPRALSAVAWHTGRRSLERALATLQPEVIYAHGTLPGGYLAWQLHRRHGLPFVIADFDFGEIADCARFPERRRMYETVTREAHLNVAAARKMEAEFRQLFPASPVRTIHQGIAPPPAGLASVPRPRELEGRTVLFSAGTFYPRKGFPLLIEAFARVAPRHPEAVLRIAGDGAERGLVEQRIREAHLEGQVQLLGFRSHEQVLQEMAWCDAFVLIGWDEPFATVFIEAMASGRPILTASDGGINDVVRPGEHGLVVPPRDVEAAAAALEQLISDRVGRVRMGAAAGELARTRLTWEALGAELAGVLCEAARRPLAGKVLNSAS